MGMRGTARMGRIMGRQRILGDGSGSDEAGIERRVLEMECRYEGLGESKWLLK